MENKINIAELLKDCPQGMELDCTMFENLEFERINKDDKVYPIICRVKTEWGSYNFYSFNIYGCYINEKYSKCVIFPKGKTTWEGFHRPFEDGNILFIKSAYSWVLIYKGSENKEDLHKYVAIPIHPKHTYIVYDNNPLCCKEDVSEIRFATEEEKAKLFQAIKDNGYKWNAETKTLEKLIEPKFKVGDRIKQKGSPHIYVIIYIEHDRYRLHNNQFVKFVDEKIYELVPNKFDINTLKPFESIVLVRDYDHQYWRVSFFGYFDKFMGKFDTVRGVYIQCIPYEGNEHLLGTTDNCDEFYKTW